MPIIRVEMLKGRSVDDKRRLAQALTETYMKTWNVPSDGIHVTFDERELHNWALSGELFSDRK